MDRSERRYKCQVVVGSQKYRGDTEEKITSTENIKFSGQNKLCNEYQ